MQAFADVDGCLVLIRQALRVEVRIVPFGGNPNRLDVLEFRESLHDFRPDLYLREILLRVAHLRVDPRTRLRTVLILEPTIRIGDRMSRNGIGYWLRFSWRGRRKNDSVSPVNFLLWQVSGNGSKAGKKTTDEKQPDFHEQSCIRKRQAVGNRR